MFALNAKDHDEMLRELPHITDVSFPFNIFHNYVHNQIIHLHWHPEMEIVFIVNGHARFFLGNQSFIAVPGDIVFVNKEQLHTAFSIDNTLVEYYAIVFDDAGVLGAGISSDLIAHGLSSSHISFPGTVKTDDAAYSEIHASVKRIIEEWEQKKLGYDSAIRYTLSMLFLSVVRTYSSAQFEDHSTPLPHADRFKALFEFVESHFREPITVQQACKIMNVSSYHFCRLFKRTTGRTFIEFVNLYRVNEAERLLRETSLSITEISDLVGFCNVGYLNRVFKAIKRVSPSQCRKGNHLSLLSTGQPHHD